MPRLTPFLLFNGNCKEAMTFYAACFGGEAVLTRLGDTPMAQSFPVEKHDLLTYAHLKCGAIEISATDWLHPTRTPEMGNMTAMYVTGTDADELRRSFRALSAGADTENFVALVEMPFGLYGRLTDRFGKEWFFRGEGTDSSKT